MMIERVFEVDSWRVTTYKFSKEDKRLQEGIITIGDDYMGVRGSLGEGYSGGTLQGTYLAGAWFPNKTVVGWQKDGYPEYLGKILNASSFIGIGTTVNGEKLDLARVKSSNFESSLDMHRGLLSRSLIYEGEDVRVRFEFERFPYIIQKEAAPVRVKATVLERCAKIDFDSTLDRTVVNEDSNYDECFWIPFSGDKDRRAIQAKTKPNPYEVPQFTVLLKQALHHNRKALQGEVTTDRTKLNEELSIELDQGQSYEFKKDVIVVTSHDIEEKDQADVVEDFMKELQAKSFEGDLAEHTATWKKRWGTSDVEIDRDAAAQQGTRFNIP